MGDSRNDGNPETAKRQDAALPPDRPTFHDGDQPFRSHFSGGVEQAAVEKRAQLFLDVARQRPIVRLAERREEGLEVLGHDGGDHIALVIDTSASMTATAPDGKPRIAEAKAAAMGMITRLAPGAGRRLTRP